MHFYAGLERNRLQNIIRMLVLFVGCCSVMAFSVAQETVSDIEHLDPNMATQSPEGDWLWYDALSLGLEGQGWTELKEPYDRLPAKAEGVVRDAVWSLSRHSAGLAVHFVSDAQKISARWTLRSKNLAMPHMPATGVSGLDLYVRDGAVWRWIGAGRPDAQSNEKELVKALPKGQHEFLLYLPLYNGVTRLEIGVPPRSMLAKAPARPASHAKPICFYGTSITHGGCASRPGMAYPAILGRWLQRECINIGFSGNGKLEPELGELLAELDVAAYVLDCAPNLDPEQLKARIEPFIEALRKARPDTPIVLVENISYQAGYFIRRARKSYERKNKETRAAYERLVDKGVPGLYYLAGEKLLGNDGEATVDGTHPTDLGFIRMAEAFAPVLKACFEE